MRLILALLLLSPLTLLAEDFQFRVGVSIPLSGPLDEYGEAVRNGIELAQEQNVDAKKVQFIFDDNRYEAKMAISSVNKLLDSDKVDLIFLWGAEPARTTAPIFEKRKVPALMCSLDPGVTSGAQYLVRFMNPPDDYADKLLSYLRSKSAKRLAFVKAESSFMNLMLEALEGKLQEDEKIVSVERVGPTDQDLKSVLLRINQQSFDYLGAYLFPGQLVSFYKSAAALGFTKPSFGSTPFESTKVLAPVMPQLDGAIFVNGFYTEKFAQDYQARYHSDSELYYAANAYDMAKLVGELFASRTTAPSGDEILTTITHSNNRSGATGDFKFVASPNGDRHFAFPIVVRQYQNGKAVTVMK